MHNIYDVCSYIKEFGFKIFISKTIRRLFYKKNSKLAWKINDINENLIKKYLQKEVEKSEFKENKELEFKNKNVSKEPIWVMWWQGEENAPEIVKCCINSIRKNANNHEVIIISEKNLKNYVTLPYFIYEKLDNKSITRTHLSDIIRLNLLTIYGGLWLDATIFVSEKIPETVFDSDFFSINFGKKTKDPSHGRWTAFCMAAKENTELTRKVLIDHYKYWFHHNKLIDYIIVDYFINIEVNKSEKLKKLVENVPINNTEVFTLVNHLNDVDSFQFENAQTYLYKLSYKRNYLKEVNGKKTNYEKIVEEYYETK